MASCSLEGLQRKSLHASLLDVTQRRYHKGLGRAIPSVECDPGPGRGESTYQTHQEQLSEVPETEAEDTATATTPLTA